MLPIALILATSVAVAYADEASKQTKIEEMLDLTHADHLIQQVIATMRPMMLEQMKKANLPDNAQAASTEIQQRLMDWLQNQLSWDRLKPAYMKIYAETFTEQEIGQIVDFYKSPGGQAMLSKMPQLMQKSMTVTQEMMRDSMPEITKIIQDVAQKYKKQQ
jgi:hypothetical protein